MRPFGTAFVVLLAGLTALAGCAPDAALVPSSHSEESYLTSRDATEGRPASASVLGHAPDRAEVDPTLTRHEGRVHFAAAYPTGSRASSMLLLETDAPEEVRVGRSFEFQVRVSNLTDMPLHGVIVYDVRPIEIPQSATADPKSDSSTMRPASATQPARVEPVAWNVGLLAPRETKTRQITGDAQAVGTLSSCLAASYIPTLCSTIKIVKPELHLTKEAPSDVLICQNISYRYIVSNTGTGVADAVRIEDRLPEGLLTADGQQTVSLAIGDLRAGETRRQIVALKAARRGVFASSATAVSGDVQDQSRLVTTTVREPALTVAVQAPASRYVDEPIDYSVTIRNTGDAVADRTVLHLVRSDGLRLPDREVGPIQPGERKTTSFSLQGPIEGGTLRLTATAEAQCTRPATASAAVALLTVPALLLECVDSVDPVRVGAYTTYTITVTNQGTGADHNVTIKALVPPEELFTQAEGASTVTAAGPSLACEPIKVLAPKQSVQWKIRVQGLKAGDARFNVELTSDSLTRPSTKSESTRVVGEAGEPETK